RATMDRIYLDNAATTPIAPEVREAMAPWLDEDFGNPSSRHPLGVRAAEAVDRAREAVARVVGARPAGVIFTAGGTEANNLAVLGFARGRRRRGRHVVFGPTEHPSVRASALALRDEGFEVEEARVDDAGALDLEDLGRRLRPDTVLVAQMLVNNEFGTIYPIHALARLVRRRSPEAVVHVDAVQAAGKLDISLPDLGVDSLSISAHKIHGPKGVGALVVREGLTPPRPLIFGGGQEGGVRSGTENVTGIVGLGRALELAQERREASAVALGEAHAALREEVATVPGARLLEPGGEIAPAIGAVLLPGPPAEVYLHHLESRGVMTSVGSACNTNTKAKSPALLALGLADDEVRRILRFSFSRYTTVGEVRRAGAILREVAKELEGAVQ
ncbi:MAG: cysteine desulfurase family protein, partial [Planctomycetota bacterium]|nr:cysteine desulfurase family protein [Planctomycetota bacterium]